MGTQGVGYGDTGSGTWGHREWDMETLIIKIFGITL